jgi:hypothetical protein
MTALTEKLARQKMTDCLADQTRGCDHDPSDECSYAAIQQDFMKDMSHGGLQLRYTLTKRWPQSVRKLITSMSFLLHACVWRGCNSKLRVCLAFHTGFAFAQLTFLQRRMTFARAQILA